MDELLSYPVNAYNYVYGQYGTIGVIVSALMITVGLIGIFIWNDRRK